MSQYKERHIRLSCPTIICLLFFSLMSMTRCATGDDMKPLIEMNFDHGFEDTGSLGGVAELKLYAEGEGAYLMPGPWGDCLDLSAASRFGGDLSQVNPAGSALLLSSPRLQSLGSFTVMLWAKPAKSPPAVNARLLTHLKSFEVLCTGGEFAFLASIGDEKQPFRFPVVLSKRNEWLFLAASLDSEKGELRLYCGDRVGTFAKPSVFALRRPAQPASDTIEIGNFQGIRPFKGWLDGIRLYGAALDEGRIKAVFHRDLQTAGPLFSVYDLGIAPTRRHRFQPKHSDIFFSSRWQGRRREETFQLLKDYHATHLVWVYGSNPDYDYIRAVHDMGIFYQGTLNGLCGCDESSPDSDATGDATGRQWNLDGQKVVLPHMAEWSPGHPRWTGCQNNPAFRRIFKREAKKLLEAGVDSIHVDDWLMSAGTARVGLACFCPSCMDGFRRYLKRILKPREPEQLGITDLSTFDYREFLREKFGIRSAEDYRANFRRLPLTPHFLDFQREGLRDFYRDLRSYLEQISPEKYIPISVNCHFGGRAVDGSFRGLFCADLMDFLLGEASPGMQSVDDYVQPCKVAEAVGIPQIMMTKPKWLGVSQAALATTYALGQWFRVPWDLYMGNDETGHPAPRYYGKRDDWKKFYDFIHARASLFDGYRTASVVGVLFNADAAPFGPVREICRRLTRLQIPFHLICASSRFNRIPLDAERFRCVRFVIQLSPLESFCERDRKTIEKIRESRRIRFLKPEDDIEGILKTAGSNLIRLESPDGIYAFLRVRREPPSAVIHIVNWNTLPESGHADTFHNISVSLINSEAWGGDFAAEYHTPGAKEPVLLEVERHAGFARLTLPLLRTWGIIEIRPKGESQPR